MAQDKFMNVRKRIPQAVSYASMNMKNAHIQAISTLSYAILIKRNLANQIEFSLGYNQHSLLW